MIVYVEMLWLYLIIIQLLSYSKNNFIILYYVYKYLKIISLNFFL